MDLEEFVKEIYKSQNDGEIPWHLKPLCEHIEIVKNGGKIIIDPLMIARGIRRKIQSEITDRLKKILLKQESESLTRG